MNALHYMRVIARALDYAKDPDPSHWKTINGSHVHLDKNGNYDVGRVSRQITRAMTKGRPIGAQ